jgi:hypothetical protein
MHPPSGHFLVEHSLPGRLRVRVPRSARLDKVVEALGSRAGVIGVTASPLTGGILVHYDPERLDAPTLLETIGSAELQPLPRNGGPAPSTLAGAVSGAFSAVDARVRGATRGMGGLGVLVPAGLVLWAATQIARGQGTPLSWSSALWWAHGIFRDYNREVSRGAPPTTTDD